MFQNSKTIWWGLILLVWGIVIVFLMWLRSDEPLSSHAEQLLNDVQLYDSKLSTHPHFDTLGFDARPDVSTQVLGRLIYHQTWLAFYHPFVQKNDYKKNQSKISLLKFDYLTQNEQQFLRQILNDHDEHLFYQKLLSHQNQLQNLYAKQNVLNQRYQNWLDRVPSQKPLLLSIHGEHPNYSLIRMMHLLYLSDLVFQQDRDQIKRYIEQLISRHKYAEDLLENMSLISMLSQSVMVLNQLRDGDNPSNIKISQLTAKQMSLRTSYAVEFTGLSVYWDQINSDTEGMGLFDRVDAEGNVVEVEPLKKYVLNAVSPFVFLKNMTKNQTAQYYQLIIAQSELNHLELKRALMDKSLDEVWRIKSIRNVFGQKLSLISSPSGLNELVRIHSLNQKIQIYNVLSNNRQFDLNQLNHNQEGYEYYRTETELCIKSPDPHQDENLWKKYKSCLRI